MKIKRVLSAAFWVLMLTACGKEGSSVEAEIDNSRAEAVAQNLLQGMADKTLAAAAETEAGAETPIEAESMTLPVSDIEDVLDIDDLPGTWLMVGGEVEGDIWEAIPGNFEILVFTPGMDPKGESETVYVDMEARDYEGLLSDFFYQEMIVPLDEPLYEGCGNEEWSVRIGEESEKNEYGFPIYEEHYATLLDSNTLLMQHYFTIDGGPGVSYQIFKRVFQEQAVEAFDLSYLRNGMNKEWELYAYVDENGVEQAIPNSHSDFQIDMTDDFSCEMSWTDLERSIDFDYDGQWCLGRGGSVRLNSGDYENAWYAGAIQIVESNTETSDPSMELRLYYDGGWLCFREKEIPEVPILNVMKTTLSREEHEDSKLICSAIYDSIRLSDEDTVRYPELAKELAEMTQEDIVRMEESATYMKDLYGEGAPGTDTHFSDEEMFYVQRADSQILSIRDEFYAYSGGAHPVYGVFGYNFDTQTGKKLELDDVVTDFDEMMELVEQKLYAVYDKEMFYSNVEEYFDNFTQQDLNWTMGYQGISFQFNPYMIAPYASGMQEVTVWFEEAPELFVERYTQVPENGYVVSVPLGREYEFDRDDSDGRADLISTNAETSNDYAFDKFTITLNGNAYVDTDICLTEMHPYLVCTGEPGNSNYYLYVYGGIEDGHKMYIYDLNQAEVKRQNLEENVFFPGDWYAGVEEDYEVYYDPVFTDPTDFTMQSRMWIMGLFLGEKDYYVNPNTGSMESRKASYSIPKSTWPITSKVPLVLESLVEKEMVEFPAGSLFYYNRTDGVSYVDVRSELGVDYRIQIDTSGDFTTVNGMSVEDCFDGVTKIW